MPLLKAARTESLPPGSVTEIQAGEATYVVLNLDGKIHCLDGICPHAGGPLGQGVLSGSMLVCPWHGWEFDCKTGANDFDEEVRLSTFPVVVQGDEILIDVP